MFGCSDVYHWMGRTAKGDLLAGLRVAGEVIGIRCSR